MNILIFSIFSTDLGLNFLEFKKLVNAGTEGDNLKV